MTENVEFEIRGQIWFPNSNSSEFGRRIKLKMIDLTKNVAFHFKNGQIRQNSRSDLIQKFYFDGQIWNSNEFVQAYKKDIILKLQFQTIFRRKEL